MDLRPLGALLLLGAAAPSDRTADVLAVDQRTPALVRVDGATGAIEARAPTGVNGHEVAVSRDGRLAYLPIYGNSAVGRPGTDGRSIELYDARTLARVGVIDLGEGARPHDVKVAPDGLLWVTAETSGAVLIVDPKKRAVVGRVPIDAAEPHMLALSPDGRRAYTANVSGGSVSVIDTRARRRIATIPVSGRVQRVAVSTEGRRVFTLAFDTSELVVIDAAKNAVERRVKLPQRGYAVAPTPDGKRLLVASPPGRAIFVVDLGAMAIEQTVPLGGAPNALRVDRRGERAFAALGDGRLAVLRLPDLALEREVAGVTPGGFDGIALAEP